MFTLYEVDDEAIVVRSSDSGDIARVFRLLGYDLPVPSGTRITDVYVTIHKQALTGETSNAKINNDQHEPDFELDPELPF